MRKESIVELIDEENLEKKEIVKIIKINWFSNKKILGRKTAKDEYLFIRGATLIYALSILFRYYHIIDY